jgi:hypothetical protein
MPQREPFTTTPTRRHEKKVAKTHLVALASGVIRVNALLELFGAMVGLVLVVHVSHTHYTQILLQTVFRGK